ncbi:alaserpin-like [Arctopsyche grandis]|uniref:alaserpin-like n=1 Tax=Arctopsyche grandis TaxID=121162 RepID=UPI00406D6B07
MAIEILPGVIDFKHPKSQSLKPTMRVIVLMSFIILGCCQTTDLDIQLLSSSNKFSNQFYTEVAEAQPSDDLIMSGMSAHFALALLSLGAGGKTLDEINTALHLPNSDFTKSAFKSAMNRLNNIQGVTLNIANKLYVKKNLVLNEDFRSSAVDSFSSDIENIEFALSEEAAAIINTWVEEKTNSKIKNIISQDLLNESTRLILINAIYFKGTWELKFDAAKTIKSEFSLSSSKAFEVDMMNKVDSFKYADLPQWDAQALEMQYEKRNVSMVIILPNQIDGLANLEKNVMNSNLKQTVFDELLPNELSVSIPKFKIETTMKLNPILQKLGMTSMFSPKSANLLGLLKSDEQIYVTFVIQKAFIEVNEEGAEAAAVTAIGGSGITSVIDVEEPKRFNADHPFLYFIKTSTGDILFMGRFGVSTENRIIIDKKPMEVVTPKPINVIYPTPKPRPRKTRTPNPRATRKYTKRFL